MEKAASLKGNIGQMAYFKQNEEEETRRNQMLPQNPEYTREFDPSYGAPSDYDDGEYEDDYDDGFDDPEEVYEEEELTEEEKQERKKTRLQLLFGAGDLTGIIVGTVVILILLAFLFQMINFVRDDIHEFLDTVGRFFM